jgi:hypothetical protein
MPLQTPSPTLLNARYVAIRTAEARDMTDRLLQAARDRTPGVRRLLIPILYRFWYRDRAKGWELLASISEDTIRFPGFPDAYAVETFAEFSLATLNGCRGDPHQLNRLASIWRGFVERIFASPLAKFLGKGLMLKLLAKPIAHVMQRQPTFQPFNFRELQVTFSRSDALRSERLVALACLERPEDGVATIVGLLRRKETPFDVYLMLLSERTLIYHGVKVDRDAIFALLEQLFREGCPWFRQSILYVLFHILQRAPELDDAWLDRYVAITEEFFASNNWKMETSVAQYNFANHLGWSEIVIDHHRPGTGPRILPRVLQSAIAAGDTELINGLFNAINTIAFSHGHAPLALKLLARSLEIGGTAVEERTLQSLATIRLQDQPLADAFLEEHRNLTALKSRVEGIEPTIHEEDMPTLLDGLTVELILNSDYFRGRLCAAFRRAAEARNVSQFLVQIVEWLRDEFSHIDTRPVETLP